MKNSLLTIITVMAAFFTIIVLSCLIVPLIRNPLGKCNLSNTMASEMSKFTVLSSGPIINNRSLLYIKESTFNFLVSCPIHETPPLIYLKYGYLIPIDTYNISMTYTLSMHFFYYEFTNLIEGDYSLYFENQSLLCIFNTTHIINPYIPYIQKDIYPITNMTYQDKNRYESPITVQGFSYVLIISYDPFLLKIDTPSYSSESMSIYNARGYYYLYLIYRGSLNNTVILTINGKKVFYWMNTEGLFYKNNTYYEKQCYKTMDLYIYVIIYTILFILAAIATVFIISYRDIIKTRKNIPVESI